MRPYPGELLYSWLARVAAVYNISIGELLSVSASPWDLCAMPSRELVASLCEMTRLSSDIIKQLTISSSGIRQAWWNIRQIAPDVFFPNVEYEYRPSFKFCRLCLWDDLVSQRDEFIRREWMLAVPSICLVHGMPMEEVREACQSRQFPIFAASRRRFRLVCGHCRRVFAKPEFVGRDGFIPQVNTLQAFESALVHALNKQWTFEFPAASAGPRSFLRAVEDLLGLLLTRPGEGFEHFVNWLDPTVIRMPQRLDRQPKARPWLGDFSFRIRLGFVSHLAALLGGRAVRQRLFAFPSSRYAFAELLEKLCTPEAEKFRRRLALCPPTLRTLVFQAQSTN
jgi:hypothetical protein